MLSDEGKYHSCGAIQFIKGDTLYAKLRDVQALLSQLQEVRQIFIEEAPMMFGSASTAHVMSLLQRWNGMVCALCNIALGIEPVLVSAATARKTLGIRFPKHRTKKDTKICVVDYLKNNNLLPDVTWQYKKTGTLKDHCFDIADAYVIACAGFMNGPLSSRYQMSGSIQTP